MGIKAKHCSNLKANNLLELLERYGLPPLPPYIRRATPDEYAVDRERYQTVYASQPGAAAAPTAGLHFTPELIDSLKDQGIESSELTLHVGLGTFRPVSATQITDHHMHAEEYEVNEKTQRATRHTSSRRKDWSLLALPLCERLRACHRSLPHAVKPTSLFILPIPFTMSTQFSLTFIYLNPRC